MAAIIGLGLHIPQYVAKKTGIKNRTPVDIRIVNGSIVVKPGIYTFRNF